MTDLPLDTSLGPWRLQRPLGASGMGEVWRADRAALAASDGHADAATAQLERALEVLETTGWKGAEVGVLARCLADRARACGLVGSRFGPGPSPPAIPELPGGAHGVESERSQVQPSSVAFV